MCTEMKILCHTQCFISKHKNEKKNCWINYLVWDIIKKFQCHYLKEVNSNQNSKRKIVAVFAWTYTNIAQLLNPENLYFKCQIMLRYKILIPSPVPQMVPYACSSQSIEYYNTLVFKTLNSSVKMSGV